MNEKEKKVHEDNTEVINTEELRSIINSKEEKKKECFLKRLFKKKDKK